MAATALTALVRAGDDGGIEVRSPTVGVWCDPPRDGAWLAPGDTLGSIRVLDRRHRLVLPEGAGGRVGAPVPDPGEVAVRYGDFLVRLEEASKVKKPRPTSNSTSNIPGDVPGQAPDALVIRSTVDGIFWRRPSPGAPDFAPVGSVVSEGQTLALVEVMKTFNPLRYGGPGLPERATVVEVLVRDGAEVRRGEALVRVDAAGEGPG